MRLSAILLFAVSFAASVPSAQAQCSSYNTQSSCQQAGCTWASGHCQNYQAPVPPYGCSAAQTKVFTQGVAASFVASCSFGTAPVAYNGGVPAGMSLNHGSGYASGAPTTVKTATVYTIYASNSAGSKSMFVTITVNPPAPANLSYSANPAVYTKGKAIAPNTPTVGGGAVASYAVAPALPAGLSLSGTTGVISGTPSIAKAAANYTVTAANAGGSTTKAVSIQVKNPIIIVTPVKKTATSLP